MGLSRFVLAAALAAPLSAAEGLIVRQNFEDLRQGTKGSNTSYIEAGRVATRSTLGGKDLTFAYFADRDLLRMVDHGERVYREITGPELEWMMVQIQEAALVKMREQTKDMPPQQRDAAEKMFASQLSQSLRRATAAAFRQAGGSGSAGGRRCERYEGYRGEKLVTKVCATDWREFGVEPGDFAVFEKLADFMAKLVPQMSGFAYVSAGNWKERNSFPGVPLEQTLLVDGQPVQRGVLAGLERGPIPAELFDPPAGYRKEPGPRTAP